MATVWDKGKLLTGSNPRQATSAAVEELGKKLVNDWTAANR